jgi:hypothetical protein
MALRFPYLALLRVSRWLAVLARAVVGLAGGATACRWSISASAASPTFISGGTRRLGLALTFGVIAAADRLRSQGAEAILWATETSTVRMRRVAGCRQHTESDYRRPERTSL